MNGPEVVQSIRAALGSLLYVVDVERVARTPRTPARLAHVAIPLKDGQADYTPV